MTVFVPSFKIITVGKTKDKSLQKKIDDYYNRLKHDAKVEIYEIKDSDKNSEGIKIAELISRENSYAIALSEEGKQLSSQQLAHKISTIPQKITLIIGGPNGLSITAKKAANEILSLSKMTFPHEIAKMLLLEQLYRSVSILRNRSYHKE